MTDLLARFALAALLVLAVVVWGLVFAEVFWGAVYGGSHNG